MIEIEFQDTSEFVYLSMLVATTDVLMDLYEQKLLNKEQIALLENANNILNTDKLILDTIRVLLN